MEIDVVLPAGGRISGEFAQRAGTSVKALIKFDGSSVLERTIRCLREAGIEGRYVVIGPEEVNSDPVCERVDAVLPETPTGPGNILAGLEYLNQMGCTDRAIIANTDLPFLSPISLQRFVSACSRDVDICAPAMTRETFEAQYPGLRAEFVPLRDGRWTMGCVFVVNPEAISRNRIHIDRVFEARKSQSRMARLLGFGFVLRFLMHRLSMPDIERQCSGILGCSAQAIITSDADLAFDLDDMSDYDYALEHCCIQPNHR